MNSGREKFPKIMFARLCLPSIIHVVSKENLKTKPSDKMKTDTEKSNTIREVATMTEADFRKLCAEYGGPDEVPCTLMPDAIAATLSMADRFFDEEDTDDAVSLIRRAGLFA